MNVRLVLTSGVALSAIALSTPAIAQNAESTSDQVNEMTIPSSSQRGASRNRCKMCLRRLRCSPLKRSPKQGFSARMTSFS
jgi:hypothetical protein